MNHESVAAVVAVFNGVDHVCKALDSVLAQTQPVQELIIVNDGSSDNSESVILAWISSRSLVSKLKISYLSQQNAGQGSARNVGVANATSGLIAFLDQDDVWTPDHVSELQNRLTSRPSLGWVYSDFDVIDNTGLITKEKYLGNSVNFRFPQLSIESMLSQDLMMLPSAALIRKSAFVEVGGFDTAFRGYEDDDLFVRMFLSGWSFQYCDCSTLQYRVHSQNSSGGLTFPRSRWLFFEKYWSLIDEYEMDTGRNRNILKMRIRRAAFLDFYTAYSRNDIGGQQLALSQLQDLRKLWPQNIKLAVATVVFSSPSLFKAVLRARKLLRRGQPIPTNS